MTNFNELDKDQRLRYSRNILLTEIGTSGQKKLFESSVLFIGCGALGSISSMYIAASGIKRIGLVDFDNIDISNLQRQLSFGENDVGRKKNDVLKEKILSIDNNIDVRTYDYFLRHKQAVELISQYDVVIEGSDNPDTKYLISGICATLKKPCVIGGISGCGGQVLTYMPGNATYSDFFPQKAQIGEFTPCALGGVLGPLPGIVGSIQASEAIKVIVGFGKPLINRLLLINAADMSFREFEITN